MQVKQQTWSIEKLVSNSAKINLNPSWQRGPAWQLPRQVLLIDSILRGMRSVGNSGVQRVKRRVVLHSIAA